MEFLSKCVDEKVEGAGLSGPSVSVPTQRKRSTRKLHLARSY